MYMYVTCTSMFCVSYGQQGPYQTVLTAPSGDLRVVDANVNAYTKMHGKDSQ